MKIIDEVIQGMQTANLTSDYWDTANIDLPELTASCSVIQRNGQSVYEHTMLVMDLLTIKNPITLLSSLFHDLGKKNTPPTIHSCGIDQLVPRFPNHANESANIARIRLTEWIATHYLIDRVCRLISMHMFDLKNATGEKTVRGFIANVGRDNVDNWFALRIADSRSYAAQQQYRNHYIEPFRKSVTLYLREQPSLGQPKFEKPGETGAIQIEGVDD